MLAQGCRGNLASLLVQARASVSGSQEIHMLTSGSGSENTAVYSRDHFV